MKNEFKDLMVQMGCEFEALKAKYQGKIDDLQSSVEWNPDRDIFFYVDERGWILSESDLGSLQKQWLIDSGNAFKTKQEAESHKERMLIRAELERLADGGEWVLYWDRIVQGFICEEKPFITVGEFEFSTEQKAQAAIDTIGSDRLKKFMGVE